MSRAGEGGVAKRWRMGSAGLVVCALALGLGYVGTSREVGGALSLVGRAEAQGHCPGRPTSCDVQTRDDAGCCPAARGPLTPPGAYGVRARRCEAGLDRVSGVCCWPGQGWSRSRSACVGEPTSCPSGRVASASGCVEAVASGRSTTPPVTTPAIVANGGLAGMVLIPGATFTMGSASGGDDDERPVRRVTLSTYWIDRTEVTVSAYGECVRAGRCAERHTMLDNSGRISESGRTFMNAYCNWGASGRGAHPMNCVSWDDAVGYCGWLGKRLPTEAEWEYGARGDDGRVYPWEGPEGPTAERGNYCDGACRTEALLHGETFGVMHEDSDGWGGTAPVGRFARGRSPFGLDDMSGNVWEWVSDWYGPHTGDALTNPSGSRSGDRRVLRGGAWSNASAVGVRATERGTSSPADRVPIVGFRCARGA